MLCLLAVSNQMVKTCSVVGMLVMRLFEGQPAARFTHLLIILVFGFYCENCLALSCKKMSYKSSERLEIGKTRKMSRGNTVT